MALPCGYDGIVCTCVITTIMIVLAASSKCGIVKFFLSLLASRSRFRVAENWEPEAAGGGLESQLLILVSL